MGLLNSSHGLEEQCGLSLLLSGPVRVRGAPPGAIFNYDTPESFALHYYSRCDWAADIINQSG